MSWQKSDTKKHFLYLGEQSSNFGREIIKKRLKYWNVAKGKCMKQVFWRIVERNLVEEHLLED